MRAQKEYKIPVLGSALDVPISGPLSTPAAAAHERKREHAGTPRTPIGNGCPLCPCSRVTFRFKTLKYNLKGLFYCFPPMKHPYPRIIEGLIQTRKLPG